VLSAYSKAVAQLGDKRIRRPIWISLIGAILIYATLVAVISWVLGATRFFETGWAEGLADWGGGALVVVLSLILFPAVVSLVLGFLLEDVAKAVEARHYPHLGPAREQSVMEILGTTATFMAKLIGLNVIALVVYLLLLAAVVTAPAAPFVFYAVNGYLLAREYFELVAFRRLEPSAVKSLFKARMVSLWLAGAALALLFTVPVVNLIAPVIGTAAMVHLLERYRGTTAGGVA